MKYGTYTTIDVPCVSGLDLEQQKESVECQMLVENSYEFLKERFAMIDGKVRKQMNPHDFGMYPSFEIDYPLELNIGDEEEQSDEELSELQTWLKQAEEIENEYSKKFEEYL